MNFKTHNGLLLTNSGGNIYLVKTNLQLCLLN